MTITDLYRFSIQGDIEHIKQCNVMFGQLGKLNTFYMLLKYEISYFKSLQIVLLRLKVTSVISFVGSQFIPNSLVESFAMSLCIPQRPFIGDKTITILPVADNIDIPYLCMFFSSSATDCSILSSVL